MEKQLCEICKREYEPKVILTSRSVFGEPSQEIETISSICENCLVDKGEDEAIDELNA